MPQCSICTHERRVAIEKDLVRGDSVRDVARRYEASKDAVHRHKANHMVAKLARAAEREALDADALLEDLLLFRGLALRLFQKAEAASSFSGAAGALREARSCVETLGKIIGAMKPDGPTVQVAVVAAPEWVELRGRILAALEPHPEARAAVLAAIGSPALPAAIDAESVEEVE